MVKRDPLLLILCGSVVKCVTRNPEVLGSSRTRSSGFFSWECPWARHFNALSLVLVKARKDMNNVSCHRDIAILLEVA